MDEVIALIPDGYVEKYKQYDQLKHEIEEMETQFKDKMIEYFESNAGTSKIEIDNLKFSFVKSSVRSTIDSKKLQEEEPEIYEKYLKETKVKSSIKKIIGG